jgi:hypothetical protein
MHVERTTKGDGSLFLTLTGNLMVRYQHLPQELGEGEQSGWRLI